MLAADEGGNSKCCRLLPAATLTLSNLELEDTGGRRFDGVSHIDLSLDVAALVSNDTLMKQPKEQQLEEEEKEKEAGNRVSIGPMSLPQGSSSSRSSSSSLSQTNGVSFSLNSQNNKLNSTDHQTTTKTTTLLSVEVNKPSSSIAYRCSNNNQTIFTEPTFREAAETSQSLVLEPIQHVGKPQRHQSSTFNAKFRVHSRHRSIGRFEELTNSFGQTQSPLPSAAAAAININKPLRSLLVVCHPTTDHDHHSVGTQIAESHHNSTSVTNTSFNSNNNNSHTNLSSISESKNNNNNKLSNSKSIPNQLNKLKLLEQDNNDKQANNNMSQTLQSIHSLSMQLNQASSLRGSSHLDDELEPQMTLQSHHTASGAGQGSAGKFIGSNKFSRLVGKKASRVKELLLQNLGKADKTTDDLFKMYEENFYRQQNQALKLQKEFKSYINALKGTQEAGKSLNTCIQQSTGDYQSARHDLVCENLSQLEHLDEDLMEKLRGQILVSVSEYLSQFNELRDKIAKRRRKLIDFDSSRRVYEQMLAQVNRKRQQQANGSSSSSSGNRSFRSALTLSGGLDESSSAGTLQSATSQLVDEARLLKLREQYNYCKIMYETINGELHEELPMVYEKKMKNLLMTLQNYFSLEAQFHSNAGKLFATASDVIDELPMTLHQHHQLSGNRHENHHISPSSEHHHHHHLHNSSSDSDYGKTMPTSGSSGMGSSGGDSPVQSTSSLNADTLGDGSPTGEPHEVEIDDEIESMHHSTQHEELEEEEEPELEAEAEVEDEGKIDIEDNQCHQVTDIDAEKVSGKELGQEFVSSSQTVYVPQESYAEVQESGSLVVAAVVEENACSTGDNLPIVELPNKQQVNGDEQVKEEEEVISIEEQKEVEAIEDSEDKQGNEEEEEAKLMEKKCLYKVKTSYKYLAEDVDELCFEADEIIQVIEFDDNQEQEEGWLMGVREVNGQKGLFPANFTRPV